MSYVTFPHPHTSIPRSPLSDELRKIVYPETRSVHFPQEVEVLESRPDGGPADYYDLPPNPKTLNDLLEYKGDKHWLGDSFHLANIVKAAWRWGIKSGTDKSYDARKFIYSGVRLLLKYQGLTETRATLQKLLDDPQFGGGGR